MRKTLNFVPKSIFLRSISYFFASIFCFFQIWNTKNNCLQFIQLFCRVESKLNFNLFFAAYEHGNRFIYCITLIKCQKPIVWKAFEARLNYIITNCNTSRATSFSKIYFITVLKISTNLICTLYKFKSQLIVLLQHKYSQWWASCFEDESNQSYSTR